MRMTKQFHLKSYIEDVVRNYGINNNLHLSGFEEYMNDCLGCELERTYTDHPYLNYETNKIEIPNSEVSTNEIFVDLLKNCENNGDEACNVLKIGWLDIYCKIQ